MLNIQCKSNNFELPQKLHGIYIIWHVSTTRKIFHTLRTEEMEYLPPPSSCSVWSIKGRVAVVKRNNGWKNSIRKFICWPMQSCVQMLLYYLRQVEIQPVISYPIHLYLWEHIITYMIRIFSTISVLNNFFRYIDIFNATVYGIHNYYGNRRESNDIDGI